MADNNGTEEKPELTANLAQYIGLCGDPECEDCPPSSHPSTIYVSGTYPVIGEREPVQEPIPGMPTEPWDYVSLRLRKDEIVYVVLALDALGQQQAKAAVKAMFSAMATGDTEDFKRHTLAAGDVSALITNIRSKIDREDLQAVATMWRRRLAE